MKVIKFIAGFILVLIFAGSIKNCSDRQKEKDDLERQAQESAVDSTMGTDETSPSVEPQASTNPYQDKLNEYLQAKTNDAVRVFFESSLATILYRNQDDNCVDKYVFDINEVHAVSNWVLAGKFLIRVEGSEISDLNVENRDVENLYSSDPEKLVLGQSKDSGTFLVFAKNDENGKIVYTKCTDKDYKKEAQSISFFMLPLLSNNDLTKIQDSIDEYKKSLK